MNRGTVMSDTRSRTVTAVFEEPTLWLARGEVHGRDDQKHEAVLGT